MNSASILEMARGAIEERVNYEMDRVIKNIIDLNTSATARRKLVVEITLQPDDDRRVITVSAISKSTLAPTVPIKTALYMGIESTGELRVVEMTPNIPGQLSIAGDIAPEPKILKLAAN